MLLVKAFVFVMLNYRLVIRITLKLLPRLNSPVRNPFIKPTVLALVVDVKVVLLVAGVLAHRVSGKPRVDNLGIFPISH